VGVEPQVVGSTAQIAHRRLRSALPQPVVKYGSVVIGMAHRAGGLDNDAVQRRRSRGSETGTGHAHVRVDVDDGLGGQLLAELLHPLGGANDAELLGVPVADQDAAPWPPSLAGKFPQRLGQGEEHGGTAVGIGGAEGPGVVVAPQDHPLVRQLSAPQMADDISGRNQSLGLVHVQAHGQLRAPGESIREGQTSLPVSRNRLPLHAAEDLGGRAVWQGRHRDARQPHIPRIQARDGPPAVDGKGRLQRREGISRIAEGLDRAALDGARAPVLALGIYGAASVPAIGGIGEEDEPHGTCSLGILDLEAPVVAAVPGHGDPSVQGDSHVRQQLKILAAAEVHIDHFGDDIA